MDQPIKKIALSEVKTTIMKHTNSTKAPGFDLITGKILKELPSEGYRAILFNAVLKLSYYLSQWKVAHIAMLAKTDPLASCQSSPKFSRKYCQHNLNLS